jgi:hypothetical protein
VPALYLGKAVSSDDRDALASRARYAGIRARERPLRPDRSLPVSRSTSYAARAVTGRSGFSFGLGGIRSRSGLHVAATAIKRQPRRSRVKPTHTLRIGRRRKPRRSGRSRERWRGSLCISRIRATPRSLLLLVLSCDAISHEVGFRSAKESGHRDSLPSDVSRSDRERTSAHSRQRFNSDVATHGSQLR